MILNLLLSLNVLVCIALIGVVLLQRSEGGALGSGGGPTGLITTRGAGDLLTRTTWILFAMFLSLSLALTLIGGRMHSSQAIIDRLKLQSINPDAAPAAQPQSLPAPTPAAPTTGLPDSLSPSLLPQAPAAAPAAAPVAHPPAAPTLSAPTPSVRTAVPAKPARPAPAVSASPPPVVAVPAPAPRAEPAPPVIQVPQSSAPKPADPEAPVKTTTP